MNGFAFLGFGAGIVPLGLILLLVVAIAGGRNETDPNAERPAALYYAGVMFVALFTALFAVFTVVASLLNLTLDKQGVYSFSSSSGYSSSSGFSSSGGYTSSSGGSTPSIIVNGQPQLIQPRPVIRQLPSRRGEHDSDYANALRGIVIAAIAIGVYAYHDRRRRGCALGPVGERVRKTYLYAVSFVSTLTYLVAGGLALYGVIQMIAPGVTSAGTRGAAAVHFGQSLFLAAAAGVLFVLHLRDAEPETPAIGIAPAIPPEPPAPPPRAVKKAVAVKKAAKKRA